MIQASIAAAFSSMGISGTPRLSPTKWVLDSRASHHMTWDSSKFTSTHKHGPVSHVQIANGQSLPVQAIGNIHPFSTQPSLRPSNVLHVPQLSANLLSVGQLANDNCHVSFSPNGCFIQDQGTGQMRGKETKDGSLFSLDLEYQPSAYFSTSSDISLWHRRLGHPNDQKLLYMFKNKLLPGTFSLFHNYQCHACSSAKAKTLSFPLHSNKTSSCFELAHSDVWGVTPVISRCGYKYFIIFINDFSRFTWVYFLHSKSDAFTIFSQFVALMRTQFNST